MTPYAYGFNVLVYREGDWYVAQVIERDISTQARELGDVIYELGRAVAAHIGYAISRNEVPFIGLPETPPELVQRWHQAWLTIKPREESIDVGGNTPPPFREIRYQDRFQEAA